MGERHGNKSVINRVVSVDILDEDSTFAYEDQEETKQHNNHGLSAADFVRHLFDILSESGDTVSIVSFIKGITESGLRENDPRLQKCMAKIESYRETLGPAGEVEEDMMVDLQTFSHFVKDDVELIRKAYTHQYAVPEFHHFTKAVTEIFENCEENDAGEVNGHNPQFLKFPKEKWGLAICTVDGQRFGIGDYTQNFPIQACMKPLLYAIAMHELKPEVVHNYVGQEPSGEIADMIKLDYNNKPHNPMINTGAITMCSLLKKDLRPADKFDYISDILKKFTGGEYIGFNNTVFLAERDISDRNMALAYYLKENDCFPENTNLNVTMDFFNQMMSIESSCDAMSVVAATLANGGICPLKPQEGQLIDGEAVQHTLSLMHSCGMYEFSGQFAFQVGLPAKSSRSGGIMLVVPNVCGICMWSPPLDSCNNSIRGLQFCNELVERFNFHQYDSLVHTRGNKEDPRRRKLDKISHDVTGLLFGASNGDLSAITRMSLSGAVDMDLGDYDGRTALHVAAAEGQLEIVQFLLENHSNIDINARDRFGKTPLDDAVEFKRNEIANYLKIMMRVRQNPEA